MIAATPTFRVTRQFVSGLLAGTTFTDYSRVALPVTGKVVKPCAGSSAYIVTECVKVAA
jgi:hypothetical protein